jgi:hypothetical protein
MSTYDALWMRLETQGATDTNGRIILGRIATRVSM